jgi:hypothetical protein
MLFISWILVVAMAKEEQEELRQTRVAGFFQPISRHIMKDTWIP